MSEVYKKYRQIQERSLPVLVIMFAYCIFRVGDVVTDVPFQFMCSQLYSKLLLIAVGVAFVVTQVPEIFARQHRAYHRGFIAGLFYSPKGGLPWRTCGAFLLIGLSVCGVLEILHAVGCGLQ